MKFNKYRVITLLVYYLLPSSSASPSEQVMYKEATEIPFNNLVYESYSGLNQFHTSNISDPGIFKCNAIAPQLFKDCYENEEGMEVDNTSIAVNKATTKYKHDEKGMTKYVINELTNLLDIYSVVGDLEYTESMIYSKFPDKIIKIIEDVGLKTLLKPKTISNGDNGNKNSHTLTKGLLFSNILSTCGQTPGECSVPKNLTTTYLLQVIFNLKTITPTTTDFKIRNLIRKFEPTETNTPEHNIKNMLTYIDLLNIQNFENLFNTRKVAHMSSIQITLEKVIKIATLLKLEAPKLSDTEIQNFINIQEKVIETCNSVLGYIKTGSKQLDTNLNGELKYITFFVLRGLKKSTYINNFSDISKTVSNIEKEFWKETQNTKEKENIFEAIQSINVLETIYRINYYSKPNTGRKSRHTLQNVSQKEKTWEQIEDLTNQLFFLIKNKLWNVYQYYYITEVMGDLRTIKQENLFSE